MAWSIAEVARMSSLTPRTLRHYDAIGLLAPAFTAENGYRYYEQEQLLRLQELLLLRELGVGLADIAEVLDGGRDRADALRQHLDRLQREQARLGQLTRTVARTIRQLEGEHDMTAPELFEGFADRQRAFETDLVEQHGEGVREHFASARAATEGWTREDHLEAQRVAERIDDQVLAALRAGSPPDSPAAMAVMEEHYAMVARWWTPDRQSYTGLGQLYVDSPEFRQRYDEKDPRLAGYLRDATAAYAVAHLS